MITTNADYSLEEILPRLAAYTTGNVVEKVTCENKYEIKGAKDLAENGPISGSAVFNKESFLNGEAVKRSRQKSSLAGSWS